MPLRPCPWRRPRPGGQCPPRRRRHPPPPGQSSVSARSTRWRPFSAAATATARPSGTGPTATPPATRHSASSASITRLPTASQAKSYRPCHKAADGRWLLSRPDEPLPLYNLPAILAAPPQATVAVLEGEKCTDLAASLGLPFVTTSAHGAKAPQLTDWSPLAGRRVAILRDADRDGEGYAAKVGGDPGRPRSPRPRPCRVAARPRRRRGHRAVYRSPPLAAAAATPRSSPNCKS